jgi:hypothetical protein
MPNGIFRRVTMDDFNAFGSIPNIRDDLWKAVSPLP